MIVNNTHSGMHNYYKHYMHMVHAVGIVDSLPLQSSSSKKEHRQIRFDTGIATATIKLTVRLATFLNNCPLKHLCFATLQFSH